MQMQMGMLLRRELGWSTLRTRDRNVGRQDALWRQRRGQLAWRCPAQSSQITLVLMQCSYGTNIAPNEILPLLSMVVLSTSIPKL
jgi:hypothetical protein